MSDAALRHETHLQNKREAFDGMRAYHQSELSHKADAIAILTAILSSTILIYGGIIGVTLAGLVSGSAVAIAVVLLFVVITASASAVVHLTSAKIASDAARYALYASEYVVERSILGLDRDLASAGYSSAWISRAPAGAPVTVKILQGYAALIVFAALTGCWFGMAAVYRYEWGIA